MTSISISILLCFPSKGDEFIIFSSTNQNAVQKSEIFWRKLEREHWALSIAYALLIITFNKEVNSNRFAFGKRENHWIFYLLMFTVICFGKSWLKLIHPTEFHWTLNTKWNIENGIHKCKWHMAHYTRIECLLNRNDGNRINDQKCQSEALEGSHHIKSFISFS